MKTKLTDDRPVMEKSSVSHQELKDLAIYLEGMYKGQGNILPLGRVHIDNLWTAISHLETKSHDQPRTSRDTSEQTTID